MDGAAAQRAILEALRAGPRTMAGLRRDVGDEGLHGTMGERDPFEEDVVALVEAGLVTDPDGFLRLTADGAARLAADDRPSAQVPPVARPGRLGGLDA